jgi:hypothetical protein
MNNPFKPSPLSQSINPWFPFGQPSPMMPTPNNARFLDDPIVWTCFLRTLGNSDAEDAETIDGFARRLGIDRSRITAKIAAHYHECSTLQ